MIRVLAASATLVLVVLAAWSWLRGEPLGDALHPLAGHPSPDEENELAVAIEKPAAVKARTAEPGPPAGPVEPELQSPFQPSLQRDDRYYDPEARKALADALKAELENLSDGDLLVAYHEIRKLEAELTDRILEEMDARGEVLILPFNVDPEPYMIPLPIDEKVQISKITRAKAGPDGSIYERHYFIERLDYPDLIEVQARRGVMWGLLRARGYSTE